MIRIVLMSTGVYGTEIDNVIADEDNINDFADEGNPIIMVNELTDLDDNEFLNFTSDDVTMM